MSRAPAEDAPGAHERSADAIADPIAVVLRTADALRRALNAIVEPHGITFQQYNVLRTLAEAHPHPLTVNQLGERLHEQTPGTTRLLDRLEARDLVRRERRAANRRIVDCRLRPAGSAVLRAVGDKVEDAKRDRVARMDVAEAASLLHALRRLT